MSPLLPDNVWLITRDEKILPCRIKLLPKNWKRRRNACLPFSISSPIKPGEHDHYYTSNPRHGSSVENLGFLQKPKGCRKPPKLSPRQHPKRRHMSIGTSAPAPIYCPGPFSTSVPFQIPSRLSLLAYYSSFYLNCYLLYNSSPLAYSLPPYVASSYSLPAAVASSSYAGW